MFQGVQLSTTVDLGVWRPRSAKTKEVKLDEEEKAFTKMAEACANFTIVIQFYFPR